MKLFRFVSLLPLAIIFLLAGHVQTTQARDWEPQDWWDEEVDTYECYLNWDYGYILWWDEWNVGYWDPASADLLSCDAEGIDCSEGEAWETDSWFACLEYCESIYVENGVNHYPWVPDWPATSIDDWGSECQYHCVCRFDP